MLQTTPRGEGVTDDIIFSGAGSGCSTDDEDDCSNANGSGGDKDALVRPIVKVKTTPRPPDTVTRYVTTYPLRTNVKRNALKSAVFFFKVSTLLC